MLAHHPVENLPTIVWNTQDDPRIAFATALEAGARLCLLPFSRVFAEEPIQLAENLVFYPPGSLTPEGLRVVSFPSHEWQEVERRSEAITPGWIEASGSDLTWLKSGASKITIEVPRVYRRVFYSKPMRRYQGRSCLHRMRPPFPVAADGRLRHVAARCCTN